MAKESDQKLYQRGEQASANIGPLSGSAAVARSRYPLAGLIGAGSALVVAMVAFGSVGCASSAKVAVVPPERQERTPHVERSPVTEALDRQTGQMAEEDQRRAAQGYQRIPSPARRFRDEPIRPPPRP